jgi:hypothetical protein
LHGCYNAYLNNNGVTSSVPTLQGNPAPWMSWIASGFRVALSPKSTLCNNAAVDVVGGSPHYPSVAFEIGDPFEFHGNCAPSTFKLNTMENSTARGLYMGGMPIGGAVNGTIIGDQGAAGDPYDNFWVNFNNPNVYHTDFNNVFGTNNEFYMTYSTNGFINNAQPPGPIFTFTSFQTPGTVSCGGAPFIATPTPGPRELDVFDDIALDSISELGGNDTSRYFGKEFLYNQIKNDSLLTSNSVFSFFKDSVESTNAKPMEIIKEGLIFPLDSSFLDTLTINLAQIQPMNNLESNFKTLMEIISNNPELKDSVFTYSQFSELRRIAQLCPYTDGTAVYSARVILHQFEPDSNYYNYCEFSKRPDRQSNARTESENKNEKNSASNNAKISYNIVPNPNNGSFMLNCPNDEQVELKLINSSGQIIEVGRYKPMNGVINLQFMGAPQGVYFLKIQSANSVEIIKLILQQ